jgi:hypothetical protein
MLIAPLVMLKWCSANRKVKKKNTNTADAQKQTMISARDL